MYGLYTLGGSGPLGLSKLQYGSIAFSGTDSAAVRGAATAFDFGQLNDTPHDLRALAIAVFSAATLLRRVELTPQDVATARPRVRSELRADRPGWDVNGDLTYTRSGGDLIVSERERPDPQGTGFTGLGRSVTVRDAFGTC